MAEVALVGWLGTLAGMDSECRTHCREGLADDELGPVQGCQGTMGLRGHDVSAIKRDVEVVDSLVIRIFGRLPESVSIRVFRSSGLKHLGSLHPSGRDCTE